MPQELNATVSKTPLSRLQTQNLTQTHAHANSECSTGAMRLPFSLRRSLSRIAFVAGIICAEVRSCYGRIGVLFDSKTRLVRVGDFYGLDLGPICVPGTDGHLECNTDLFARSACIESISAKYNWLSVGDDLLILEGWERGKQFALRSACSPRKETAEP